MKNILYLTALCCVLSIYLCGCTTDKQEFFIGVSQCSDDEWRMQMNKEIQREVLFYPDVKLEIKSAGDDSKRQIADIEAFVGSGADLLIVSPNEAEAIAPVIERAYDAGIPVILVDRKISSEKYTAYVGADNYEIGYYVGNYIADRMFGKGKMVEITGLTGSTPALERHRGMMAALKESGARTELVATADAGWREEEAEAAFDSILRVTPEIDLVFAHNDRMAQGAYRAALKAGRQNEMLFVGIDALAGKGYGVEQVMKGELNATFIYPTGGDIVVQQAMNILQGKKFEKDTKLSTALVDGSNARVMQMQTVHISRLDQKIEMLNSRLDTYLMRYSAQKMFLYACLVILLLIGVLLFFVVRAFWMKTRLNMELANQKQQVEKHRDRLIELSRRLEEATHAKLAFFTNVSHDFRTPLTLISDPVNQLLERAKPGTDEYFLLNIVQKNVTVLLRLITQILDFRKFENGKLVLHLSEFDISESVNEWTEAFRTLSYRKHIHFSVNVDKADGSDYTMIADREKMERITYNLLSNAFKFTPENENVSVDLSCFDKDGERWLRFVVSDTGVGMKSEHIRHIFERFYQPDVYHGGSGIGLALVKAFVEMQKGTVSADSEEGKGSVFVVELPMKQAGTLAEGIEKSVAMANLKEGAVVSADQETVLAGENAANPEGRETVLVIDDNQDVREYVKSLLTDYRVLEASNGQEGLQQAMKYVPDVVICDVMMPIMDGMECCRRLKTEMQTSHIPVMLLTAYTMDDQKVKGYECGADSYIMKPFSAKLLRARLRNLLDNRHRLQNFFSDKTTLRKETMSAVDKNFVERLRDLIEQNLGNPELNVEELGTMIGMSRVQLYRKSKALTGYSPNELLRITRLKKAAQLLASTEKTISEVGYEVGFSAPSYFTKCYKEYFGESPTDFLKRKG